MHFTWDVDPILLDGPTPLRFYGLLMAAGLIGGFFLFRWQMLRAGHDEATASVFLAYALVAVIVGARLGHCLFYDRAVCFSPPWRVLLIWQGGLASHGALLGMLLATGLYARLHRLSLADVFDRLAFGSALATFCVRIGNFFNSEIVGRPTHAGWGVRFPRFDRGLPVAPLRHPVQLYEAGLGLALLALFLLLDRRLGERRPRGLFAALFLTIYFGGRLGLEQFKAWQALPPSAGVTMGQILSVAPASRGLGLARLDRRPSSTRLARALCDGPANGMK